MTKVNPSFAAACRGFRLSPRQNRIACKSLEAYLPHCTSIQALAKTIAYAMVTPLELRQGYWPAVFNSNQHFHSNQGLLELRRPPRHFEDLLLVDFSVLCDPSCSNLLTQYPTFKTKLITELSLIAKGRASFTI